MASPDARVRFREVEMSLTEVDMNPLKYRSICFGNAKSSPGRVLFPEPESSFSYSFKYALFIVG